MSGKVPLHGTWDADLTGFDPESDVAFDPETDAAWDLGWEQGAKDLDPPAVPDRPANFNPPALLTPPTIPDPNNARAADFRVDRYDRAIVNPPVSRLRRFMRTVIMLAMLAGGASLAWEYGADWYQYVQAHGPEWYALLEPQASPPSQPEPQIKAPDRILDANSSESAPMGGMAINPSLETTQKPIAEPAAKPEPAALPASPPPAEAKAETEDPPEAVAAAASGAHIKRVPTPETEPKTIPGWRLREVIGETVVLEGPNGIRKAKRGDTVPGVGEVQSVVLWGKHLLVATSRGLIGTR